MTLVDTNVLLDVLTDDPQWADWSLARLEEASLLGALYINDVVFSELSVRFDRIEDVEAVVGQMELEHLQMPRAALFLAGKAFRRYRGAGGVRTGVLADFFIGAHAAIAGQTLLTRDAQRYRTYFPTVRLIVPEENTQD